MTKRAVSLTVVLLTLAAGLARAPVARAFYCDGGLVAVGDHVEDVRALCGDPTTETTETITRTQTSEVGDGQFVTTTTTRSVIVWTYDFGPRRLGERLVVEGEWVIEIRETGYGRSRRASSHSLH